MSNKKPNEIIRNLREDNDLNQAKIAKIIGTSQQYYSKYERGKFEIPLRTMIALADYYEVSLDYLAGRTDCAQGVYGLNKDIVKDYSVSKLISDILSLNNNGRRYIVEYIDFQKSKNSKRRD
jgi:transcriptional regulator with XRE-family HTH domain